MKISTNYWFKTSQIPIFIYVVLISLGKTDNTLRRLKDVGLRQIYEVTLSRAYAVSAAEDDDVSPEYDELLVIAVPIRRRRCTM